MKVFRDFNIINNQYWVDQKEKTKVDKAINRDIVQKKFWKTHNFNPLVCSYYDQDKEQDFLEAQEQMGKEHGKNFNDRLPPTLKVRETIVFDPYKEVPAEVKAFDLKKKNQKKRYELRYELEEQYRDRDIKEQDHNEQAAINRYNGEKFYEEALKGYDDLTLEPTNLAKYEETAHVKPKMGVWEKLQSTKADMNKVYKETDFLLPSTNTDFTENEEGFVKTRFPQYVHADHDNNAVIGNSLGVGLGNTVDTVYETMVKQQEDVRRKRQEGLKFEPYHKDLRKIISDNNGECNANAYNGNGGISGNVGFDSMVKPTANIATNNNKEILYEAPQPRLEAIVPDMLYGGTEMNTGLRREPEQRYQNESSSVSEKLSATNKIRKDTFENALRNNNQNINTNDNNNYMTGENLPTKVLEKKGSFYTVSSQRSAPKNRLTIHAFDDNKNLNVNERLEKVSNTSGSNKFPSINKPGMTRENPYEPCVQIRPSQGRKGSSVKSGSQKSERLIDNIQTGGF